MKQRAFARRQEEQIALVIERAEWSDAEARLRLMEEAAARAIRDGAHIAIRVTQPDPPRPPLLLPARLGDVLLGPDGKPIKEI